MPSAARVSTPSELRPGTVAADPAAGEQRRLDKGEVDLE